MDIYFKTKKLEKEFRQEALKIRRHGKRRAELIDTRLDEFYVAKDLEMLRSIPRARCHELKGNRTGQLSVDLDHPYRLIFQPAEKPYPRKPDGGLDWSGVKAIIILGVEDTHE